MNLYAYAFMLGSQFVSLSYAIIGFGILIVAHEFGHFFFCKLFGIHTPSFSIGMGPVLFKKKIGRTEFCLSAIPIGGYLEIAGSEEVGQGNQKHAKSRDKDSFAVKPFWQKAFVLLGGILFNLFFAYFTFSTLFFVGMPVPKKLAVEVKSVSSETDSLNGRFKSGDKVISINEVELSETPDKLYPALRKISEDLQENQYEDLGVKVLRDDDTLQLRIPITESNTILQKGLIGGSYLDVKTIETSYESYPLFQAIGKGIKKTHDWIGMTLSGLKTLVTKRNIKDFGGPILIVSQSFKMAQQGIQFLLIFLAIISINLAIVNLLPIGALDGGQLLFETIEFVTRRKIPEKVRLGINLVSWVLLIGLILFISFQDLVWLLSGYFS